MSEQPKFRVQPFGMKPHVDDDPAVLVIYGRLSFSLTIAEARELGLALEREADEAEAKLDRK